MRRGRFAIARVTGGGTSLLGSDFDRCGRWPTAGAGLGMEGLTPTAPVHKLPGSTDTLRCSVTEADEVTVAHAERSGPADPDRPGSVARHSTRSLHRAFRAFRRHRRQRQQLGPGRRGQTWQST